MFMFTNFIGRNTKAAVKFFITMCVLYTTSDISAGVILDSYTRSYTQGWEISSLPDDTEYEDGEYTFTSSDPDELGDFVLNNTLDPSRTFRVTMINFVIGILDGILINTHLNGLALEYVDGVAANSLYFDNDVLVENKIGWIEAQFIDDDWGFHPAGSVPPTVPEPTTVALLVLGFAGIGFSRRRRPKL